jgi:hypothetical protein
MYTCECSGHNGCQLKISSEIWENVRETMTDEERDHKSILHPDCPNVSEYEIILQTDDYIIVEYYD